MSMERNAPGAAPLKHIGLLPMAKRSNEIGRRPTRKDFSTEPQRARQGRWEKEKALLKGSALSESAPERTTTPCTCGREPDVVVRSPVSLARKYRQLIDRS